MSAGIVIGLIILVAVLVWVLRPLFVAQQVRQQLDNHESHQKAENLLFERETLLRAIGDLKFDHQMGKLSDEDFAQLDAHYRAKAIQILRQLDELGIVLEGETVEDSLDQWIEQAVAQLREGRKPPELIINS